MPAHTVAPWTVVFSASDPAASHCQPTPPLETPGHSFVWLSLLWGHCSFLLGPGVHKVLSVPSKCLFPQFCNQIPLAFKVTFPGGSQSLSLIPRLGNLLWALELLQQLKEFFDIILSSLWVVCSVALLLLKPLQSFPTVCDPIDGSPPGSPVPGILRARTLEWVAISFSNA